MDTLWDEVIKLAAALATVTLVPLASAYLMKLLKRAGLAVEAEEQAKIEKMAQEAILAAEEWARAELKARGTKALPDAKLSEATETLMARVPSLSDDEADAVIHAQLAKLRVASGGALLRTPAEV